MINNLSRVLPFAAVSLMAAVAHAQASRSAPEPAPISRGVMNEWIATHHANVFAGDPHVNWVTIVVDTKNQYVASVADSMAPDVTAALDAQFAAMAAAIAAHNAIAETAKALVAGRLRVPGADDGRPVRPDPENPLINANIRRRLLKMGVGSERVDFDNVQWMRAKPGVVGSNRMYLTVLRLKRDSF